MRSRLTALLLASLLAACASNPAPTPLTITTSTSSQTITGPVVLTASRSDVTWALSGPGSLSGSSGREVTYRPQVPGNSTTPATATVTATSGSDTASVTFTISPASSTIPGGKIAGMSAPAQVVYDAQQVPHIFCATPNDCLAVQGFLHAQDRLFEMDLFRRTARGQLASMVGSVELGSDQQFLTLFVTRDGKRIEDAMVGALDPVSKAALDAYVAGVNAYLGFLRQNPQLMPGEYAQLPGTLTPTDIPAWTEQDTLAIARLQQFQLSETIEEETAYGLIAQVFGAGSKSPLADANPPPAPGRFFAYVHSKQPISDFTLSATDNPPTPAVPPRGVFDMTPWSQDLARVHADMQQMHEMFGTQRLGAGSNNWVVDAAHSATGKAMVANDPHLALYYPPLFHLAAMTAGDGSVMDIAGGSFPGVPGALVGRGAHVGWGVTVVGYDVTDLYLETVNDKCPGVANPIQGVPCVAFGGGYEQLLPVPYQIAVRGQSTPSNFTVLVAPHHGPIISYTPGATTAVSMRWTGHDATDDLAAFIGLALASGVGTTGDTAPSTTAFAALRNYAVGAQNFVLADDKGNIGYDPHARVPLRPWAGQNDPVANVPLLPWLPLPGYGSAEWGPGGTTNCAGTGANAPGAACWTADTDLPQAVNPAKGYLATANSDPIGTTDAQIPVPGVTGKPYLSFDWDDPTDVRYSRIAGLLKAKTANSGKVSMQDMQAIQSDHVVLVAKLFNAYLPPAIPGSNAQAYAAARAMLLNWGDSTRTSTPYDCPTGLTGTSPSSAEDTNANNVMNSAACLLFHQYLRTLLTNVFSDDFQYVKSVTGQSVGNDGGRQIRAMLYMLGLEAASAPGNLTPAGTEFCRNVNISAGTQDGTDCFAQEATALVTAYLTLNADAGAPPTPTSLKTNWLWGKYHTLTAQSPAAPLIASGYAAGPFARPGGALTVDVGNPDDTQSAPLGFSYSHGSNVRFIGELDPSASAQTLMQLPGYEHDQPSGVFANAPDLLSAYVQNQYFNYLMGHQVDANAVSSQGFGP